MEHPIAIDIHDFRSPFGEQCEADKRKNRSRGAEYARIGLCMTVNEFGVWSGSYIDTTTKCAALVTSYEKIGYHAGADQFLLGFLLAGGRAVFHGFKGIHGLVTL